MRKSVGPALLVGLFSCAVIGCAGAALPPALAPAPASTAAAEARFATWEATWLAELGATDPRLAMRLPGGVDSDMVQKVAAAAVVRGEDVGITLGALDLFSYGEKERHLRSLRESLAREPDDGVPAVRAEEALLGRLVDGEELRVTREREVPTAVSERVRSLVATWGTPRSPREVAAHEQLVARGLGDVLPGIARGELGPARSLELEDALDELERLAVPEGYPESTRTITELRIELGRSHHASPAAPRLDGPRVSLTRQLEVYLGDRESRAALTARLEDAELTLRNDAKARLDALPDARRSEALALAAAHVDTERACPRPRGRSRVLAMGPPPERALVCDLVALVAEAREPNAEASAVVALHDDVAVALWALALDSGALDLDATRTAHPLLASVRHDRQDRLVRAALVSPARLIAPGLAATLLDADGANARRSRAERWSAFGDAPLDVVAAEIGRSDDERDEDVRARRVE